ncbi:MAG: DUF5719 family protein [Actinomycetota bacterium]|nr:DUF5719 family protein [Actinomycetota bacterium]
MPAVTSRPGRTVSKRPVKKYIIFATSFLLALGLMFSIVSMNEPALAANWTQLADDGIGGQYKSNLSTTTACMQAYDSGSGQMLYAGTQNQIMGCGVWRYDNNSWTQINADGFGNPTNTIATSMAVFGGNLYVGTYNNVTPGCSVWRYDGSSWTQVVGQGPVITSTGPGFGNAANTGAASMAVFGTNLYVGTNNAGGCEIWRSPDGTAWTQVDGGVLGGANIRASSMVTFGGNLYVGTQNNAGSGEIWRAPDGIGWTRVDGGVLGGANTSVASMAALGGVLHAGTNNAGGCEIWRSPDGTSWNRVDGGSLGANNTIAKSMAVFGGDLYVGTYNGTPSGCEVWRTSMAGGPPYTDWARVGNTGFGDPFNTAVSSMIPYESALYMGTSNTMTGSQAWAYDGSNLVQVNDNGYGNNNHGASCMAAFNGNLYVGTENWIQGCDIWRFGGSEWLRVANGGFGDNFNQKADCMAVYDSQIYVSTTNGNTGCEIWRSPDGTSWNRVDGGSLAGSNAITSSMVEFAGDLYVGTDNGAGCEIWRSPDGTSWNRVDGGTLGAANTAASSMAVFVNDLYVGTANAGGCEIWRSPDGTSWNRVDGGTLGAANIDAKSMAVFAGDLYVGTDNGAGCEIWRSPDGTAWNRVDGGTLGGDNTIAYSMLVHDSRLWVGTENWGNGCEMWSTAGEGGPPFTDWTLENASGFGNVNNGWIYSMAVYFNSLTVGTVNFNDGCEVYNTGSTWYLAEGYTGGAFDEWVLIQNPGTDTADVTLEFQVQGGTAPPYGPFALNGGERQSIHLDILPNLTDAQVSTKVTSNRLVVAERAMYFDYYGDEGGHDSIGVNQADTTWYLAEGYTGGDFDTWVLVQNPGTEIAQVTLDFQVQGGTAPPFGPFDLPAGERFSVHLDELTDLSDAQVSTRVTSDQPVVAERAMYFDYYGNSGGHDSKGVTSPDTSWYLAEGYTGGDFDTWVLIQNPGTVDAAVTLDFQVQGGTAPPFGPFDLPAGERFSVHLDELTDLSDAQVSTRVTSDQPVVAERAEYFTYDGKSGGHDSVGVTSTSQVWYLAEGYTGGEFDEWVLVQNPGTDPATVTLEFQLLGGGTADPYIFGLNGGERFSVHLDDLPGLADAQVSTKVTSDQPVVSERAMYFTYDGKSGGHDSVGYAP